MGRLLYFHLEGHWIGQDGGMCSRFLYPRVCPHEGTFCEGVKANPFRVTRRKSSAAQILPHGGGVRKKKNSDMGLGQI